MVLPDVGRSYVSVRPEAEILIGLKNMGLDVTVMTDPDGPYAEHYRNAGISLIDWVPGKKVEWRSIRLIRQTIKQKGIQLVYATKSRTIPNAAFACIGLKVKMVAYRGTTGGLYRSDLTNYLSILNPRVDGIICVSDAVKDYVAARVRRSLVPQVKRIFKGHSLDWYRLPPIDLHQFGISDDEFAVLCVGSAREHKGMRYLIEAAGHLNDIEKLKILLVGDGFDGEPFQSLIQQSGMAERIIQPGFRNDVPQLAAACDLFVLPSLREGLSRAILESLASGTPVVTSDCGGPGEMIEDGHNGFVVPIKDGQAIADKIRLLYQDRDKLAQLASNTQSTITEKFSHQQSVKQYAAFFEQLLSQG